MSTAIEQAIEILRNRRNNRNNLFTKSIYDAAIFNTLNLAINDLKNILPIEKQQLQDAFCAGETYSVNEGGEIGEYPDFEQFYSKLKGD